MEDSRYVYYSNGVDKIIAVSHYAGRTVRGIAKCNPADKFDVEKGKQLAHKRCEIKIHSKRLKRANEEYEKAVKQFHEANERLHKMSSYVSDSYEAWKNSMNDYEKLIEDMGQ